MAWAPPPGPAAGGPQQQLQQHFLQQQLALSHGAAAGLGNPAAPHAPAALAPPTTDSLLSRFGLCAGDRVIGRFLVGDSGNKSRWYRG